MAYPYPSVPTDILEPYKIADVVRVEMERLGHISRDSAEVVASFVFARLDSGLYGATMTAMFEYNDDDGYLFLVTDPEHPLNGDIGLHDEFDEGYREALGAVLRGYQGAYTSAGAYISQGAVAYGTSSVTAPLRGSVWMAAVGPIQLWR